MTLTYIANHLTKEIMSIPDGGALQHIKTVMATNNETEFNRLSWPNAQLIEHTNAPMFYIDLVTSTYGVGSFHTLSDNFKYAFVSDYGIRGGMISDEASYIAHSPVTKSDIKPGVCFQRMVQRYMYRTLQPKWFAIPIIKETLKNATR